MEHQMPALFVCRQFRVAWMSLLVTTIQMLMQMMVAVFRTSMGMKYATRMTCARTSQLVTTTIQRMEHV